MSGYVLNIKMTTISPQLRFARSQFRFLQLGKGASAAFEGQNQLPVEYYRDRTMSQRVPKWAKTGPKNEVLAFPQRSTMDRTRQHSETPFFFK